MRWEVFYSTLTSTFLYLKVDGGNVSEIYYNRRNNKGGGNIDVR